MKLKILLNQRFKHKKIQQQHRQFWPLVIAGVVIAVGSTIAQYGIRAIKRMKMEEEQDKDECDNEEDRTVNYKPNSVSLKECFGLDIGSSFSRICYSSPQSLEILENCQGLRASPSVLELTDHGGPIVGKMAKKSRHQRVGVIYGSHLCLGLTPQHKQFTLVTEQLNYITHESKSMETGNNIMFKTVNGTIITPSLAYKHYALDLLKTASAKIDLPSTRVASIAIPTHFDDQQAQLAIAACRNAGFNCAATVRSSLAAILGSVELGYLNVENDESKDVLAVVDVGGRFTELSLYDVKNLKNNNNALPQILAQKGNFCFGCNDLFCSWFTSAINSLAFLVSFYSTV